MSVEAVVEHESFYSTCKTIKFYCAKTEDEKKFQLNKPAAEANKHIQRMFQTWVIRKSTD